MAIDSQICPAIVQCLQISLADELGPQNLIDILRLLEASSKHTESGLDNYDSGSDI